MPLVTSDILSALTTNFRALWQDQFLASEAKQLWPQLATEIPSESLDETYTWLGTVPKMREWVSERQFSGLLAQSYTVRNKDWEVSIEIDRNAIEDNRLKQEVPRIRQLATEAVRHRDELVISTMVANGLAYDGQNFFDTDHSEGDSGTQANTLAGTGVTDAALTTDYQAARAAMWAFKDDAGRPMSIKPTHILAPPQLEGGFRRLLNAQLVASGNAGVTNPWQGTAELMISPYLTDVNDWFLLALDQPVKPLVFQNRKPPEFVALDKPDSEAAFHRKKFKYGVDARYNVGFGFWQMALRTTN